MYQAFDRFLSLESPFSGQPGDEDLFYEALETVVREPAFSPEDMGDYFRSRKGIGEGHPDLAAVRALVTKAWAVRDFIRVSTRLLPR